VTYRRSTCGRGRFLVLGLLAAPAITLLCATAKLTKPRRLRDEPADLVLPLPGRRCPELAHDGQEIPGGTAAGVDSKNRRRLEGSRCWPVSIVPGGGAPSVGSRCCWPRRCRLPWDGCDLSTDYA